MQERRRVVREPLNFPLRYQVIRSGKYGASLTRNIGEGGLKVVLDEFIPTTSDLILEINLPKLSKIVNAVGRVVWSERIPYSHRYEIGMKFLEIKKEDVDKLKEIVGISSRYSNSPKSPQSF